MIYFDDKQIRLIHAWHNLSMQSEDAYMAFMADWITFNAICYNLYYDKAIIERANIDRDKSRRLLNSINEKLKPSAEVSTQKAKFGGTSEKWSIDILLPERLFISVSNNYTEDIIFNEFVKENQNWYNVNQTVFFENLKKALAKGRRNFVINMAKENVFDAKSDIETMADKNIVVLCEENNLKTIKNVLYQIRCNIFHGEKTPGDFNDDRIVRSALPLLRYIIEFLLEKHHIKNNAYNSA
jgi:hypothetical protein